MPLLEVKLYIYQLFRSLAYIHSQGICHRDIKPQNLLLDPNSGVLKLCDFGSAKILVENEPNVSYICSRYYRAPELIFGATNYTTKIGKNTSSCILLLNLHVGIRCLVDGLRYGRTYVGTTSFPRRIWHRPACRDHQGSGHPYTGSNPHHESQLHGAQISTNQASSFQQSTWAFSICVDVVLVTDVIQVFRKAPQDAIELISALLEYTPPQRLSAIEAMCHPFFDELRDPNTRLPDSRHSGGASKELPNLFDFSRHGTFHQGSDLQCYKANEDVELSIAPELNSKLVPAQVKPTLAAAGLDIDNFTSLTREQMMARLD